MYYISDNSKDNSKEHENTYIKQLCTEHIYTMIDVSKFKYEILQNESELLQLLEKKYLVSVNFSGSNCFLVFTKIKDKFYQFMVDRKTLSYNSLKINLENVKLTNINVKIDIDIYYGKGTIFDGTFIQNKDSKTFIISDVYMFKGKDLTNNLLESKLLSIKTYLESNYNQNDKNNNLILTMNKLYKFKDVDELINIDIPKIKKFSVRGLNFYPDRSGTRLIFLNNSQGIQKETFSINNHNNHNNNHNNHNNHGDSNNHDNSQKQNHFLQKKIDNEFDKVFDKEINKEYNAPLINVDKNIHFPKYGIVDTSYVFELKKQDFDVYNLNIIQQVVRDNKTLNKRIKVGLAYIPNIDRSAWCGKLFSNDCDNVLVNCKFHCDNQKWEPINIESVRTKPSFVNDFMLVK